MENGKWKWKMIDTKKKNTKNIWKCKTMKIWITCDKCVKMN